MVISLVTYAKNNGEENDDFLKNWGILIIFFGAVDIASLTARIYAFSGL